MIKPIRMQLQKTIRPTTVVGLWVKVHSRRPAVCPRRMLSSKWKAISRRRMAYARIAPMRPAMRTASTRARTAGSRLATLVSTRAIDACNADSICCHMAISILDGRIRKQQEPQGGDHGVKRSGQRQRAMRYGLSASNARASATIRCSTSASDKVDTCVT